MDEKQKTELNRMIEADHKIISDYLSAFNTNRPLTSEDYTHRKKQLIDRLYPQPESQNVP